MNKTDIESDLYIIKEVHKDIELQNIDSDIINLSHLSHNEINDYLFNEKEDFIIPQKSKKEVIAIINL